MNRVLDIDLDFFLNGLCEWTEKGERPPLAGAEPWAEDEVRRFLTEKCLLSLDNRLPGRIFETHDGALRWWEDLLSQGKLRAPYHVTHVDAHSDLGIGKPGPGFVLYNVLSLPPARRLNLQRWYDANQLDEANYLLFALAMRRIASLDIVREPFSRPDVPAKIAVCGEDGAYRALLLPQSFPGLFGKQNGPEPSVPFHAYDDYRAFCADAPYDFVSLALSPRYAPREADALARVIGEYMTL